MTEASFNDISFIARTLNGFDEDGLKTEWQNLYSNFTIEEKQGLAKNNFDNMWRQILKRHPINNPKYPNLKSLLNAVRSLPNSNADPERTFSVLSGLKTKTRNRLSSTSVNVSCVSV